MPNRDVTRTDDELCFRVEGVFEIDLAEPLASSPGWAFDTALRRGGVNGDPGASPTTPPHLRIRLPWAA